MSETRGDSSPTGRPDTHELLLALAGRLDDDLLAWARELVAVGEEGQAVELVTAALAAERVALPAVVRAAVVAASRAAYTDLDADAELAPGTVDDATGHRFDATTRSGERVAAVLASLPARRLAGCALHLTWRLTPAGAAPGPVPRAVVLVETGPDRSADVLAYLLTTELDRAGLPASVEVFAAGSDLPAYHVAALRSARPIDVGASVIAPAGVVVARTVAEAAARAEPPTPVDPVPVTPGPVVPGPADTAALFVVSSDDQTAPGEPRRPGRRRRREPTVESPAAPGVDDAPDTDPFQGPLRVPLLAPLLDPTTPGTDDDRPAVPTPIRPVPAVDDADGATEADRPVDEARPVAATEPAVPEIPDDVPQEWEDDWRSGEWAMPPGAPPSSESFDVFETTAARSVDENAVERTGRTVPARPAPELPSRAVTDRPDAEPVPAVEEREPFAIDAAGAGTEGTAALPRRDGRSRPADGSLFDSPTGRMGPQPRPAPPRPIGPSPNLPPPDPGDVPLFGEPSQGGGPPPDPARAGRRRRPDPDEPSPTEAEPSVLSSTEHDLLAQLQAELTDRERRPRPYRRARSAAAPAVNGHGVNGHGVNGHGSDGPGPSSPDPGTA